MTGKVGYFYLLYNLKFMLNYDIIDNFIKLDLKFWSVYYDISLRQNAIVNNNFLSIWS